MFRTNAKFPIIYKNFGIGSTISANKTYFLLVHRQGYIRLVNMDTFELSDGHVKVEDENYITQNEAREIVKLTNLDWTFTDFRFDTKGFKTKFE